MNCSSVSNSVFKKVIAGFVVVALAFGFSFPTPAFAANGDIDSSITKGPDEASVNLLMSKPGTTRISLNASVGKPPKTAIRSVSGGDKSITVKWRKASSSKISGYQIKCSIGSSVSTGRVMNIGKYSTSKKITGLKSGTRFYVKIRTYKSSNGSKVYSSWSTIKSAVTKKAVTKSSNARSSSGGTVYITNTGDKYHRSGCSSLRRSCIPISRSSAISQGYGACKRCRP